ncbi:MAG: hypothetical protein IJ634_08415 [Bacteroidales bacterium]|nr:hypothetical protein [Bacteroidales bacterium]
MRKILIILSLLAFNTLLWANGDPVSERSALTLARTPMAVHVPEVQLLDEQCRFTLHATYTEVEVRYLLFNRSDRAFKALPYGFPVDYLGQGAQRWESLDIVSESIVERGWRDSYVRDVMFSLDGRSLAWQCSADTVLTPERPYVDEFLLDAVEGLDYEDPLLKWDSTDTYSAERTRQLVAKYGDSILYHHSAVCRRWYYVRLDIAPRQVVELSVRYRIENNTSSGLYEVQAEFAAGRYTCGEFRYDFSPAAYWGDGHADRFHVELDTSDIVHYWQPVSVSGLDMRKQGRGYLFESRRFDLAAAEPLEVSYCTRGTLHEDLPDLLSRRISPDRYTITLSGVDPKYPAANLSDMDLATATVLRPGRGDSLYVTIRFHDSVMLNGLLLYNGYCKDRQTWLNNSRIDTLYYNFTTREPYYWGETYSVARDRRVTPELMGGTPTAFTWQALTDAAIKVTVEERRMNYVFPWPVVNYRQKVKEITLLVTAVTPGAKYNDLCISEIILIEE